jgi:hypothetical protein
LGFDVELAADTRVLERDRIEAEDVPVARGDERRVEIREAFAIAAEAEVLGRAPEELSELALGVRERRAR